MAAILRFSISARKEDASKEWAAAELAEFVRASTILRSTGLPVGCETGVSDEGDPWVIFLREDTGDVVAHIAKIDGQVVAASTATDEVVIGPNFRAVMDRIVRSQPLVLPTTSPRDRIHLHPTTVIIAFIATALSWSLDDDVKPYDWKVDDHGVVALNFPSGRESTSQAGVLREAVLSKAEAGRLGVESGGQALSSSLIANAMVAVVAIVLNSTDLLVGEQAQDRMTLPAEANDHAIAVSRQSSYFAAIDAMLGPTDEHISGDELAAQNAAGGRVDLADQSQDDRPLPVKINAAEAVPLHNGSLADNVNHVDQPQNLAILSLDRMEAGQPGLETVGGKALHSSLEASAPLQTSPVVAAPVSEPAGVSVISAHSSELPGAQVSPHIFISVSSDASEFLAHLFSSQQVTFSSSTASSSTASSSAALPSVSTMYALESSSPAHQESDATGELAGGISLSKPGTADGLAAAPNPATNSGYQLIHEILSFAADSSHELSAPANELLTLQMALTSQPFFPNVDRILIIDVPDLHLNAEVFRYSEDLTIMTQRVAATLLPHLDLHAQAELTLFTGETLKLIGVVEVHPALSTS